MWDTTVYVNNDAYLLLNKDNSEYYYFSHPGMLGDIDHAAGKYSVDKQGNLSFSDSLSWPPFDLNMTLNEEFPLDSITIIINNSFTGDYLMLNEDILDLEGLISVSIHADSLKSIKVGNSGSCYLSPSIDIKGKNILEINSLNALGLNSTTHYFRLISGSWITNNKDTITLVDSDCRKVKGINSKFIYSGKFAVSEKLEPNSYEFRRKMHKRIVK